MLRAAETTCKTDTGRQRRDNEDSAFARAPVFVVADGMGGAQAGEVASRIAIEAFEQGLPDDGSAEERLATRVREANHQIYERSRADRGRAGMGTTLTAAYVDDAHVAIAHVGDSRAYLFRDGTLQRLTQDHSLVDELVRRGKLTEEQAAEHPQRSIITRALGPEPDVEVDTWTYPARAGDVMLLCSDGLTSMISEERVREILAVARQPRRGRRRADRPRPTRRAAATTSRSSCSASRRSDGDDAPGGGDDGRHRGPAPTGRSTATRGDAAGATRPRRRRGARARRRSRWRRRPLTMIGARAAVAAARVKRLTPLPPAAHRSAERRFGKPLAALVATVDRARADRRRRLPGHPPAVLRRHRRPGHRDGLPRPALRPAVRRAPVRDLLRLGRAGLGSSRPRAAPSC